MSRSNLHTSPPRPPPLSVHGSAFLIRAYPLCKFTRLAYRVNDLRATLSASVPHARPGRSSKPPALALEHRLVSMDAYDTHRQIENTSQLRLDTLKSLYEDRLRSLTAQLAYAYQSVSNDGVLAQLAADGASAHFVPARREEIIFDLLHSEREQVIGRLIRDLAKAEAEAKQSFLAVQAHRQQKEETDTQILELEQRLAAAAAERDEYKQTAERCRAEVETANKRLAAGQAALDWERAEMAQSVDYLKEAVALRVRPAVGGGRGMMGNTIGGTGRGREGAHNSSGMRRSQTGWGGLGSPHRRGGLYSAAQ